MTLEQWNMILAVLKSPAQPLPFVGSRWLLTEQERDAIAALVELYRREREPEPPKPKAYRLEAQTLIIKPTA